MLDRHHTTTFAKRTPWTLFLSWFVLFWPKTLQDGRQWKFLLAVSARATKSSWCVMRFTCTSWGRCNATLQNLVATIGNILASEDAPGLAILFFRRLPHLGHIATIRHQAVQLSLVFMCSINQLSPGAYFLRRDFFPSIVAVRLPPALSYGTKTSVLFISSSNHPIQTNSLLKLPSCCRCWQTITSPMPPG
jgi:hypothetical protein